MTALAIGASVTVSVRDGGTVAIATNGGSAAATVTLTEGGTSAVSFGPLPERRVLGPFREGATVTLANASCGGFDYDVETAVDPTNVIMTGGVIGPNVRIGAVVSDFGPGNPLYLAHRGSAALYPEESAVAYNRSLADGEALLECDVQTLSDGALGLMHDSTVDRTTAGTGNVNSFSTATFKALTMDASVWLGSNYGDTLNPVMFQDFIDAYKTRAIFFPEDKDGLSMAALLRVLVNSGVARDRAVVQGSILANLAAVNYAGFQSMLVTSGSTSPAQMIAAAIPWVALNYTVGDATIQPYISAGLKAVMFTVNRRVTRDKYLSMGASGFFTDDPMYLRGNTALAASDFFGRQTWAPGMLASPSDAGLDLPQRGMFFAPNYWGYTSTVAGFYGCLMGFLNPIANPDSFSLTVDVIFDSASAADRWACFYLSTDDRKYDNGSTSGSTGYLFLMRKNGVLSIHREDGAGVTLLGQVSGSTITDGTEVRFKLTRAGANLTLALMSGATVANSVSVPDSTYRTPNVHLGRNGLACKFRNLQVS